MKKVLVGILALMMILGLVGCGKTNEEIPSSEVDSVVEEPVVTPAEVEEAVPNYAEILPDELQGVWCDEATEGILSLYAFEDSNIECYIINIGVGAGDFLSGTYTIEDSKLSYSFTGGTGYSNFTYDNNVLTLTNANGEEIKKLSDADLIGYLEQEEASGNHSGVVSLADLILNYYSDSAEISTITEKKEAAAAAITAAGEAALNQLKTTYDKIQRLTWYEHKNQPKYVDTTCFIYPYIGRTDDGYTWLRVKLNYTDAKTDAGWIFFDHVIFSVDGENTTKYFNRSDIIRDNDTEVWETADFEPDASEVLLLRSIANSEETIIRFEGDEYYVDHTVTEKEKTAISDVLTAYNFLKYHN